MKTATQVITEILRREGGYSDRAADQGGPTNFGITAQSWGSYKKLGRAATDDEIKAISDLEARKFYWDVFVAPWAGLPEPLRSLLVDWAVNSGPDDPVAALQRVLKAKGAYRGPVDGVLGPLTRTAIATDPDPTATFDAVVVARVEFYFTIVLHDTAVREFLRIHPESQLANLHGWTRRALEFLQ
jgi:lysozyme family protein